MFRQKRAFSRLAPPACRSQSGRTSAASRRDRAPAAVAGVALALVASMTSEPARADGWTPPPPAPAFDAPRESSWSGWRAGFHVGLAITDQDAALDTDDLFFFGEAEPEGDGRAAASAIVRPEGVRVDLDAKSDGASQATSGSAADIGGGDVAVSADLVSEANGEASAVDADTVDPAAASLFAATASFPNNAAQVESASGVVAAAADGVANRYVVVANAVAQSNRGAARALGVAAANAFDLGAGGALGSVDFAVGGHIGYDRQLSSGFVVGVEFDVTGAPGDGERVTQSDAFTFTAGREQVSLENEREIEFGPSLLASARLRFGYAFDDVTLLGRKVDLLPYVTGGVGFGRFEGEVSSRIVLDGQAFTERKSISEDVFGGVLGAGLSTRLSDRVTLSAEGLYYFLDEDVDISGGTINQFDDSRVSVDGVFDFRLKLSVDLY